MKQKNKYLLKNTLVFAIGNFGTKMISFFLVPLYTNLLTTGEYGTIDLVLTIGMIVAPFLTCNIAEGIMRFALDEDSDYVKIMSIGLTFMLVSVGAAFLLIPFLNMSTSLREYTLLICAFTVTLGFSQIALGNLRGQEKILQYSIGNIIQSFAIATLNILFLMVFHRGVRGYFEAYILANTITTVYALFVGEIKDTIVNFKLDKKLLKEMVKYSVILLPNGLMWWIMNSSDRIMITAILGVAANGIFAVAYKIPTLLTTIANTFTQAWSYSAIREENSDDKEAYSNQIYKYLVITLLLLSGAMLVFCKPFLMFYVEESYYIAWKYTPYLIIGFIFTTLSTFVGTTYIVHKDSKGFLKGAILGAGINIILNLILIYKIGLAGAAIATAVGYFIVFCYRVKDTKKYLKLQVINKEQLIGYLLLSLMCVTIYLDNIQGYLYLILEYVVMLVEFRKYVVKYADKLLKKIKRK